MKEPGEKHSRQKEQCKAAKAEIASASSREERRPRKLKSNMMKMV